MSEPSIRYSKTGTTFAGEEAVEVYRATVLWSSLGLLSKGITPTRGLTVKKALALCTQYTGQSYKRTEIDKARNDLKVWIETMKSTIPTETV